MYLFYFDESGDPGVNNSRSDFFALGCLYIKVTQWDNALKRILEIRKYLKEVLNVQLRAELKSTHIVNRRGPLAGSSHDRRRRMRAFISIMKSISSLTDNPGLSSGVFAVGINKPRLKKNEPDFIKGKAWEYALQRVDRFLAKNNSFGMIFFDQGYDREVIKLVRKMRRVNVVPGFYGSNVRFDCKCERFVEDAIPKDSRESYFIQLADYIAYAAHRHLSPIERLSGYDLWNALDKCILAEVNSIRGGPKGIVLWP